jgi:signal peptidase I
VRATRVILAVLGLLTALLVLGAVMAGLGARSLGWSPGGSTVHVVGVGMAPTVADGDYLLVQPYSASRPKVGDIVVMHDPYDHSRLFVKRVVAGPGQTVLIRNAQVITDGRQLDEPYIAQEAWMESTAWPPSGTSVTMAPDEYFVLGDNRNHSADSRVFGPVHRQDITGRAVRILLPNQRARAL